MSKFIIGYDGSERARDAIALGEALCPVLRANPVIVDVWAGVDPLLSGYPTEEAIANRTSEIEAEISGRFESSHPLVQAIVGGSAAGELTACAESYGAAVVVVGASHRSTLGRIAIGSVGSSLIHGSPFAVAVALPGLAEQPDLALRRVGVAFDGSPESWTALETAIDVARSTGGQITVYTVADFPVHPYSSAWSVLSSGEMTNIERTEKQRVLDLALGRIPADISASGVLLEGSAGRRLAEVSGDVDLTVVGSRGFGPIGRTFLGSVANHLIHSSKSSMLVLPRGVGLNPLSPETPRAGAVEAAR